MSPRNLVENLAEFQNEMRKLFDSGESLDELERALAMSLLYFTDSAPQGSRFQRAAQFGLAGLGYAPIRNFETVQIVPVN
jgi:hypothetical protein